MVDEESPDQDDSATEFGMDLVLTPEQWPLYADWMRQHPELVDAAADLDRALAGGVTKDRVAVVGIYDDHMNDLQRFMTEHGFRVHRVPAPGRMFMLVPAGAEMRMDTSRRRPAEPSVLPADPLSAEEFDALVQRVVVDPAQHRFVAALPDALPALADFARQFEELAQVAEVIEYESPNVSRAEGVSVIRISARWEELLAWARDNEWRIMRIPGAVRKPVEEGGISGPVFLMQRRTPAPPDASTSDG